jgi:hypothetical protein
MFDGINPANEWFALLCPQTNVPLFTVSNVSGDDFDIDLDSSGRTADYNGTTETTLFVWKHPGLRIIQGTTDGAPSSQAGFTGDRYIDPNIGGGGTPINYYCKTSGTNSTAVWDTE